MQDKFKSKANGSAERVIFQFLCFNNTAGGDGHLQCTSFTLAVRERSSVPPWELSGSEPLRKRSLVWDHLIPAENLQLLLFLLPLLLQSLMHPARLVDLRTRWLMPERSLQTLDTHSAHWGRSCWRRLVRRKEKKKGVLLFWEQVAWQRSWYLN